MAASSPNCDDGRRSSSNQTIGDDLTPLLVNSNGAGNLFGDKVVVEIDGEDERDFNVPKWAGWGRPAEDQNSRQTQARYRVKMGLFNTDIVIRRTG